MQDGAAYELVARLREELAEAEAEKSGLRRQVAEAARATEEVQQLSAEVARWRETAQREEHAQSEAQVRAETAHSEAQSLRNTFALEVASCDKVVADAAKLRTAYKEQKTRLARKDEWAVEARAEARKLKSELDFWREEHSEQIQQTKDSNSAGWFSGLDLMTWGSSETCSTDTGQASEANRESRERDELLREVRCWKAMYAKEARLHETAAANVARLGAELAHWRRHEDRSTKSDRTAHEKSTRSDAAHEKSTRSDRAFNDRSTKSDAHRVSHSAENLQGDPLERHNSLPIYAGLSDDPAWRGRGAGSTPSAGSSPSHPLVPRLDLKSISQK